MRYHLCDVESPEHYLAKFYAKYPISAGWIDRGDIETGVGCFDPGTFSAVDQCFCQCIPIPCFQFKYLTIFFVFCSKTIDIPIIDREEYEKKKFFKVVIAEPKLAHAESQAHIPDLRDVKDVEMRKIIEAGKPTLGNNLCLSFWPVKHSK